MPPAELTPAQQRVVDDLLSLGQPRPTFPPALAADLKAAIEEDLEPIAPPEGSEPLWIGKRTLALVHTCETHFLSETADDGFQWTTAMAAGEIAHRALERTLAIRGEPVPLDLVDRVTERMSEDEGDLGRFVRALDHVDAAELRGQAAQQVTSFVECWPPLRPRWTPRTEMKIKAELCGGRIVLSGRPDLALGVARGTEARVLLVDLKSGRRYSHHLDDLRFYALVQTLKVGVPPFRVASYYLDSAGFWPEDVTEETLEIARRRTVDGVRVVAALTASGGGRREPTITPGPACGWCRLRATCPGAAVDQD